MLNPSMVITRTLGAFVLTACAELLGYYMISLQPAERSIAWLLAPAACTSLAFAWFCRGIPLRAARDREERPFIKLGQRGEGPTWQVRLEGEKERR
jgi:hypothetical protein